MISAAAGADAMTGEGDRRRFMEQSHTNLSTTVAGDPRVEAQKVGVSLEVLVVDESASRRVRRTAAGR
jgi:hypothetical protein